MNDLPVFVQIKRNMTDIISSKQRKQMQVFTEIILIVSAHAEDTQTGTRLINLQYLYIFSLIFLYQTCLP
jgi:hypothetical protein